MKKTKLFVLISLLIGLMSACFTSKAKTESGVSYVCEEHVFPLAAGNSPVDPKNPRTPALVPIFCILDDTSGALTFNFLFSMGDVYVTLMETTTNVVASGTLLSDSGTDTFNR